MYNSGSTCWLKSTTIIAQNAILPTVVGYQWYEKTVHNRFHLEKLTYYRTRWSTFSYKAVDSGFVDDRSRLPEFFEAEKFINGAALVTGDVWAAVNGADGNRDWI